MRELKFRAYHKYMKKMLIPIKLHLDDWKITCFETLLDDNVYQVKIDDKEYWLHIMQYTWLKDKNWKEIYEGDIISFKMLKKESVPVVFIDDGFKISVRTWACSTRTTGLKYLLSKYQCEVIWNIYEDKHLLNVIP